MKIKSVRAWLQNLALRKPYTIAHLVCSEVENVFLEIELENGIIGIGAANPAPEVVGETPEQCLKNCQSEAFQRLTGCDIHNFRRLIAEIHQQFPHAPGTLAALDIALHDACAQLGPETVSLPKAAVQPGRFISTVRAQVGLGLPLALMTPPSRP